MARLALLLILTGSAFAKVTPRQAAAIAHGEARNPRAGSALLFSVGLNEVRDRAPVTLALLDLQVPVLRPLALGLSAQLPTQRMPLHYYWGGGLHFYSRPPYGGLWLFAGGGQYVYRPQSGERSRTSARALVGWRWHSREVNGSLGFAVGPEAVWAGGRVRTGALVRVDLGVDFLLGQLFY